jgi:hypothetical protein
MANEKLDIDINANYFGQAAVQKMLNDFKTLSATVSKVAVNIKAITDLKRPSVVKKEELAELRAIQEALRAIAQQKKNLLTQGRAAAVVADVPGVKGYEAAQAAGIPKEKMGRADQVAMLKQQIKEQEQLRKSAIQAKKQLGLFPRSGGIEGRELALKAVRQELRDMGQTSLQSGNAIDMLRKKWDETGYDADKAGRVFDKNTGRFIKNRQVAGQAARYGLKPFRAEFLSLMFAAQGITSIFTGMINSVLQMTGIFDAFRGILASILLPILMPLISQWLPKLMEWLKDPAAREFAGKMIIMAAVLGTIIGWVAQLALAFGALGLEWVNVVQFFKGGLTTVKAIITAFQTGNLGAGFLGVANILGKIFGWLLIIKGAWVLIWGIIEQKVWPIFKGLLLIVSGILLVIGGWIPLIVGGIIAAVVMLGDKFGYVRAIILGIVSPLATVWDMLKGIWGLFTGKGLSGFNWSATKATVGAIKDSWSAGWGKPREMAEGGIVRRRTLAYVGEAGPEAVIPLDKMSGMGLTYSPTINISSNGGIDVNDIVRRVNAGLQDELRRAGIR